MRRILQTVSVVACLAVAAGAPRGLLLAAVAAGLGIARSVYTQQAVEQRFDFASGRSNDAPELGGSTTRSARSPDTSRTGFPVRARANQRSPIANR
jgi:hypothetical protein